MRNSVNETGAATLVAADHQPRLTILGGGPAGLAAGYFARKHDLTFTVLEAGSRVGGNAITFQHDEFRFDSGAHRFHDRDPAMTLEVKALLGSDLLECSIASQIFHNGRWVSFPLSPLNLFSAFGPWAFTQAAGSLARARLARRETNEDFESFACRNYGPYIAERFLLPYSEKLWGLRCRELSPAIGGSRLHGLSLATLVREAVGGARATTRHLDGSFYYPRLGFGMIADKLAESCGPERLRTNARVTKILHDGTRINAVEINRNEAIPVDEIVCTLPLPLTAALLSPALPESVLQEARGLRFRSLLLVALFLNRSSATPFGSVYFPDRDFPMTRVYEPRNRSRAMAPPGRTMLVAEVPCDASDPIWQASDVALVGQVQEKLTRFGWFSHDEVIGGCVKRLSTAYPVLEIGAEHRVLALLKELERFENLHLTGRNGVFSYAHTHQMLRFGHDIVARVLDKTTGTATTTHAWSLNQA